MKALWTLLLTCLMMPAWAHQTSESYLYLNTGTHEGRLDVAVSDLQRLMNLDRDDDTQITWQEFEQGQADISERVRASLTINADQADCPLHWSAPALTQHSTGYHVAFSFVADCTRHAPWSVRYGLLFDRDALHRSLVQWRTDTASGLTILSPEQPQFSIPSTRQDGQVFRQYFQQGVLHLLVGYDHILFLLALLLPVVARILAAQARLQPALLDTLGIVTLFTAAHSCTLAMSALGLVQLPATLVEILIALSVSGAGVVALVPAWHRYRHGLSFGFGLVHGFGFANVLAELTANVQDQVLSLAAFNLGVEAGQVLLISLCLPAVYWGRHWMKQVAWSVPGSACAVILCGLFWTWQRL